jgi:hypothetical protein
MNQNAQWNSEIHHEGVSRNTNKLYKKLLICTGKPLDVMVNIISTAYCNTVLIYVLLKQIKFKLLLKIELLLTREF